MRNKDLVKTLATGKALQLNKIVVDQVPRYVLYSRAGPTILVDPSYAYWAISHGQASWVTTLLGVKRRTCLESVESAARCVSDAYNILMNLQIGTYVFRDYQSASTLSSIICWSLRGGPIYAKCRRIIIDTGLRWSFAQL